MTRNVERTTAALLPFDFASLQYALLVEEHGSFRLAAQVLGVRPSVVSRRVRGLEDSLGVSLFNRTSKGVQTTNAGARILRRGWAILSDIKSLKQTAALRGKGAEGRLRLGIVASIASGFSHGLLASFVTAHPDLELEVIEASPRENIAAVRALALDFTLVTGMPLSPGCEIEPLWHERVVVALPETHPLAYPSGGHRLVGMNLAADLSGACTSAVKIGGGCLDGDHHRG